MRRLALAAMLAVLAVACGHSASFDGGVLRKNGVAVRFDPVPAGWSRIEVEGADAAYRDEAHQGSFLFDVRCHQRDGDAPLASLTAHLIMGTTARQVRLEETVPFDGREARHTRMSAKLDGVPLEYDLYVMKKDDCVYDLVYVAPAARFYGGAAEFERFAAGMRGSSAP